MDCKRLFDLLTNWTRNQLGNIFINVFIGLLHCVRAFHAIQLKDRDIFAQWPSVPSTIYVLSLITFACGYRPRFKQSKSCVLAGALFGITVMSYVLIYEYVVLNSWLYIMEFSYYMCHLKRIKFTALQWTFTVKPKSMCEFSKFLHNDPYYWFWCMAALIAFYFMIGMKDVVPKLGKVLNSDDDFDKETKGFNERAGEKWPPTDSEIDSVDSVIDTDFSDVINVDGSADNLSMLPDQVVQTSHVEIIGTNNADNLNGNMCVYADNGHYNNSYRDFRDFYSRCRGRRGPSNSYINSRQRPY